MHEPGDQRPADVGPATRSGMEPRRPVRGQSPVNGARPHRRRTLPTSPGAALLAASGIGLLAAACWAVLRGILELGATALLVAGLGGWAIGLTLRQAWLPALLAAAMGVAAWVIGLVLTWLLAMTLLPGSSRTLFERLEGTPFLDWASPQLGLLELAALLLYAVAAGYTARASARPGS